MEAVLSGDGPAHSTAWRGPGRGGTDGRLTDSLSGSSIHSASVHACTFGPHECRPPKDTEDALGTEEILDGGVSRGSRILTFAHQHPTSVHPPPPCTPNPWFTNSQDSKSQILMPPPPPPHLLPISRLLQQSVHELTVRRTSELPVYPTPKSVTAPTDPLGCQILCSAAVCCGWEEQLQAGTVVQLLVDLDTLIITQVPSQHGKEVELWVSFIDRCPLLPNGGRRLYTLRLFPLLSSEVQSVLKADTHTRSGFLLDILLPLLSQILLPLQSSSLWFTPHLHFALPFILHRVSC